MTQHGELMAKASGQDPTERGYLAADLDGGMSSSSRPDLLAAFVASTESRSASAETIAGEGVRVGWRRHARHPSARGSPAGPVRAARHDGRRRVLRGRAWKPRTPFVEEIWTDVGRLARRNLVDTSVAWLPSVRRCRTITSRSCTRPPMLASAWTIRPNVSRRMSRCSRPPKRLAPSLLSMTPKRGTDYLDRNGSHRSVLRGIHPRVRVWSPTTPIVTGVPGALKECDRCRSRSISSP